jgi:hypothetical protein
MVLAVILAAGCATGGQQQLEALRQQNRMDLTVSAAPDRAFNAAMAALVDEGFQPAQSDRASGVITTAAQAVKWKGSGWMQLAGGTGRRLFVLRANVFPADSGARVVLQGTGEWETLNKDRAVTAPEAISAADPIGWALLSRVAARIQGKDPGPKPF